MGINPLGAIVLLVVLWFVAAGSPRAALLALMVSVLYLTEGQEFELLGVHLYAARIVTIALFIRVMARHEWSFSNMNRIDRAVLILYGYTAVVYLIRSSSQDLSTVAGAFDAAFCYFGFRGLVRREDDLRWLLRALIILLIPYALLIVIERVRGYSPFLFMGGLSGGWARDGVTRCMGSFRYPVSLGTFAATFLSLYIGLGFSKAERKHAYVGIAICVWIIVASNSGGSFSAGLAAIVGWGCWYCRKNMRVIRWGIVCTMILLALVMKAPVWYIITRGPFSGDSWHRAYVIDVGLRHIDKWWLFGMPLEATADWFPYTIAVTGAADITNQYLAFGITAGIGSIALFLVLISRTFSQIGAAVKRLEARSRRRSPELLFAWGLGVMMLVHVVSWFGVTYFDQIYVVWFLQLAAAVSITYPARPRGVPAPATSARVEPAQVLSAR